MKVKENNKEYILLEAETNQESIDFVDVFNSYNVTLWVGSTGHVDGIKLWKKRSYDDMNGKLVGGLPHKEA